MRRPKLFIKGDKIICITTLVRSAKAGRWIFFRHKPLHPGFYVSWSLRTILNAIENSYLHTAKENRKCQAN